MRLSARLAPALFVPLALLGAAACSPGSTTATAGPTVSQSADAPATTGAATDPSTEAPADDPGATTAPEAPDAPNANVSIAARVTASKASIRAEAKDDAKVLTEVGQTTKLGSKTTMLALDVEGDWVKVALPIRPNGSTGWMKKADVELRASTKAVSVDLARHKLVLTDNGNTVLETDVAIGSKQNPTPTGQFYVTDLLDTGNANGAYGPFAFGLSGHSETLSEFGGGDGQLGIHGTNEPASIGQAVSHGCVRVPNEIVKQLVGLVPLGTPVTIS
jgi:lipoprotein-anchoring transpeptidase ErfK/SrfK